MMVIISIEKIVQFFKNKLLNLKKSIDDIIDTLEFPDLHFFLNMLKLLLRKELLVIASMVI